MENGSSETANALELEKNLLVVRMQLLDSINKALVGASHFTWTIQMGTRIIGADKDGNIEREMTGINSLTLIWQEAQDGER